MKTGAQIREQIGFERFLLRERLEASETMKTETNHTPEALPKTYMKGDWTLHQLDGPESGSDMRWSAGVMGPRVYLQCDHQTAAFIVRACNSHERLLAMCQNALEALEGLTQSDACMSDFERACIPALQAAIALASQEGE